MLKRWAVLLALFLACAAGVVVAAQDFRPQPFDWPQWQGPQRNAISHETGLLQTWPKEGPRLLWKTKQLGGGYSAPSIAAGRIFGMGYRKTDDTDDEVVWALDERTG